MTESRQRFTKQIGFIRKFGLLFAITGIIISMVILPVSAKEPNDDSNSELTEEQKNLLAKADGVNIIATDDSVTCRLGEKSDLEVPENLNAKDIPFDYNTKTSFFSFTGTPGIYYVIILSLEGRPYITRYYLGAEGGFIEDDMNGYIDISGNYSAQMFGFVNFSDHDYPERAVEVSRSIPFTYTVPSEELHPGKPRLTLTTVEGGKQAVKVEWDKISHCCFYKVKHYFNNDTYAFETKWQGDGTDNVYIWVPGYSDYNSNSRFTVLAYSDDISRYKEGESTRSQYAYAYSTGIITIHNEPVTIFPTGINTNVSTLKVVKGEKGSIKASVLPENAPDKGLTYKSAKPAIATVDENGVVTGVSKGTTDIIITAVNGISKKVPVTVGVNPTSITLDKTSATMYFGEEMTLVATLGPAEVTEKDIKWSISPSSIGKETIGSVKDGKVKIWGAGKVTVTAQTVNGLKATCEIICLADINPNNPFADVKSDGWEFSYVKFANDNGLMNGKGELIPGRLVIAPNSNIYRSEFVQMLYKYEKEPQVRYSAKFSDVPEDAWFASAVMWASENGIVSGMGSGLFGPYSAASRQQIALMLYKYAIYKDYDVSIPEGCEISIDSFEDASKVEFWAKDALNWALANGIISGKKTKLDPSGKTKRSEFAAMIYRFDEYSKTVVRLVAVPDVAGMTFEEGVTDTLIPAGFEVEYSYEFSETVPEDTIISQTPEGGSKVKPGSKITVVISNGPAGPECPNVVGLTYSEAETILSALEITLVCEGEHEDTDIIATQDIEPGEIMKKNGTLKVTVTKPDDRDQKLEPDPEPGMDIDADSDEDTEEDTDKDKEKEKDTDKDSDTDSDVEPNPNPDPEPNPNPEPNPEPNPDPEPNPETDLNPEA